MNFTKLLIENPGFLENYKAYTRMHHTFTENRSAISEKKRLGKNSALLRKEKRNSTSLKVCPYTISSSLPPLLTELLTKRLILYGL